MLINFSLVLALIFMVVNSAFGQQCDVARWRLKNFCDNKKGVIDGGRCFFIPDQQTTTWNDGWNLCQKNDGAVMASIQTSLEMQKITDKFRNIYPGLLQFIWVGARRKPTVLGSPDSFLSPDHTFWYNTATDKNERLTAKWTWIRTRTEDNGYTRPHNCIHLWTGVTRFGDWDCNAKLFVLCQYTSPEQEFKLVEHVCVTENSVDILKSTVPYECAERCSQRSWCRSFNFKNGNTCEFFSWSVKDKPKSTKNDPKCIHYTYIQ